MWALVGGVIVTVFGLGLYEALAARQDGFRAGYRRGFNRGYEQGVKETNITSPSDAELQDAFNDGYKKGWGDACRAG